MVLAGKDYSQARTQNTLLRSHTKLPVQPGKAHTHTHTHTHTHVLKCLNCEHCAVTVVSFRIYIKKVRKFPEYGVPTEPIADKRTVKQEQEKAFQSLKNQNLESGGVIRSSYSPANSHTLLDSTNEHTASCLPVCLCRFYLQLPTERAHLYHNVDTPPIPPPPPDLLPPQPEPEEEEVMEEAEEQVGAMHQQTEVIRKSWRRFQELLRFQESLSHRHPFYTRYLHVFFLIWIPYLDTDRILIPGVNGMRDFRK